MADLRTDLALDPYEVARREADQERRLGYERVHVHEVHQQIHDPHIDCGPGLGL